MSSFFRRLMRRGGRVPAPAAPSDSERALLDWLERPENREGFLRELGQLVCEYARLTWGVSDEELLRAIRLDIERRKAG